MGSSSGNRTYVCTILMVEPNPGILIVARNVLSRAGHSVLAVEQAEEGIHIAKSERIDAVLLDARQADRQLLAALNARRQVPVILTFQRGKPIAGRGDVDLTQPGVDTAEFLEKPFSPDRLLRTVDRVIEGRLERRRARSARSPVGRSDTLVSAPAAPDDDFGDNDKTDIFPYAHLLQANRARQPSRSRGAVRDARAAQLSEHLRAFLGDEGVAEQPGLLSACLRACDAVLESATELHTVPPSTGDATPAIEGVIPELSIDQVLQLAMAVSQPSRCRIAQDGAAIDVFYDDGNVTLARHAGLPDGFLLGQLLVAAGQIQEAELAAVLNGPRDGTRLGERLVSRGHLTQSELVSALRTQTEEVVYEVVRWSTGRFSIYANERLPYEAHGMSVKLAVPHLLLEGMRRLDEWRRMQSSVGNLESVVSRGDAPPSSFGELSDEDRDILRYVDGRRTVAELVRSVSRPTFHVYRLLHGLAERRLVAANER